MNIQKLVNRFFQLNKLLYKKSNDPFACHGPDHHMRVCQNALFLARKLERRKHKINYEILIPACFLHDITAYYPEITLDKAENHHQDVSFAKKQLEKIDFPKDLSEEILKSIAVHGSSPKYIKKNESIETTILRDADKMDSFGLLGIVRIFMAMSRRQYTPQEIVKKFYTQGHLKRKWNSIKIPEAKRRVRLSYQYSLNFFKKLKKSLNKFPK